MESKSFFIFLDTDNTMWDYNDNTKYSVTKCITCQRVSEESVNALNYLMFCLYKLGYNPKVVITSGDRKDWESCKSKFYSAGLHDNYDMLKLPVDKRRDRWERIGVMLYDDYKGRQSKLYAENRKYNFLDRLHFKFYNKVDNFIVIQSAMDRTLSPMQTLTIGIGDKLNKNNVDLYMIRHGLDNSERILKKYGVRNLMGGGANHKPRRTYFDLMQDEYNEFNAIKKQEMEEKMIKNADELHQQSVENKKKKFYARKITRVEMPDNINNQTNKNQEDSNLQME